MAPVILCLLLLLLVSDISTTSTTPDNALPLAALTDFPSFVYHQYGRTFSGQWKKCIEDGPDKCPWYHSVGGQGPCQKGEVFVYNRRETLRTNGSFEPVCQPPPCPDGYSLMIPDKKCYHDDDIEPGLCTKILKQTRNLYGETFCGCGTSEATLLGSKKKECRWLFTQGPCAEGSLFVPVNDLVNFGQGQCVPSPCAKLFNETEREVLIRLPNGRTECFEFLERSGACEGNYLIVDYLKTVLPGVQHLECKKAIDIPLLYFAVSEKCVVNDEGLCVLPLKNKPIDPHPLYLEES